nr:hypothetical protein [Propionicimonas sp.]
MNPEPIDLTRMALRALRMLEQGRRAVDDQWRRWTAPGKPADAPPADRREPPDIW